MKKRYLIITFVQNSWIVSAMQSLIFWRKVKNVWSHVQIGFSDTDLDLSAEKAGIVWVSRSETIKKAKKFIQYIVPLTDEKLKEFELVLKFYEGKKYDFYFYVRWFFNTHILANGVLGLVSFIVGWNWILYVLSFIYLLLNPIMYVLSLDTWACSEYVSDSLFKVGIDYLQGKKSSGADPTHMKEMTAFAGWKVYNQS